MRVPAYVRDALEEAKREGKADEKKLCVHLAEKSPSSKEKLEKIRDERIGSRRKRGRPETKAKDDDHVPKPLSSDVIDSFLRPSDELTPGSKGKTTSSASEQNPVPHGSPQHQKEYIFVLSEAHGDMKTDKGRDCIENDRRVAEEVKDCETKESPI